MKKLTPVFIVFISAILCFQANATDFNPQKFAKNYFNAWAATQSPKASQKDLQHYLSFLTDNIGHQHYPYDPDDTRKPDGKKSMLKGMTYYLGAHTEYSAKLLDVTYGDNVVVIKYQSSVKAVHPQTKQVIDKTFDTVEVLEIEDGKVGVIRKYAL